MARSRNRRTTTPVQTPSGEVELWTPKYLVEVVDLLEPEDRPEFVDAELEDETEGATTEDAEEAPVRDRKTKRPFVMTPYQATKIMNNAREAAGLTTVNSPFMYIMARKGKFPVTYAADGRMQIEDLPAFFGWMNAHNLRQVARKRAAAKA